MLDEYFNDFLQPNGMINTRGAETGQIGLALSLLARYFHYTGDGALLNNHRTGATDRSPVAALDAGI